MSKLRLLLLFSVVLFKASGQAGSLDSSFGKNGIQTTAFITNANTVIEQERAMLTGANGSIFLVINFYIENNNFTKIVKYLPDGRIDSSYGNAGYSNGVSLNVTGATMQGDKIIVAGDIYNSIDGNFDFALARYRADGRLDSSFGMNGKITTDFNNSTDAATSIVLQGGKILVAGYTNSPINSNDFALARYTADGVLDNSFGMNGKVTTDVNGSYDQVTSIVLQGEKIILTGYTLNPINYTYDFALVRYTAVGVLDSTFGNNGRVTTDFNNSSDDFANSITLQKDKIILAGYTNNIFTGNDFALARYTADGTLDSFFGVYGKVITDFNGYNDEANAITLQEDKIIAAGYTLNPVNSTYDFALARYTGNGKLDASFSGNGKATTDFDTSPDIAYSIALQGDKTILAGSSGDNFALARYTPDGDLDASFGAHGKLKGYLPLTRTYFTSTAIQLNKIVAAGYAVRTINNNDFALARYSLNGTLDSTFGQNGKVTTDLINNSDDLEQSMTIQEDKIILAGYSFDNTTYDYNFSLARYTNNGRLDSSFGVNGKVITDFNAHGDFANSIVLQGDKILVAGYTYNPDWDALEFAVARYTKYGYLDSSFGKYGKVITKFFSSYNRPKNSIVLQEDKILVAGYTYGPGSGSEDFSLARYTADGKLDAAFGHNGTVTTDFNSSDDLANSIALQGDKIIVAGYTLNYEDFTTNFALARYTADGALDASFGEQGKVITDFSSSNDIANSVAIQKDKIILAGSSNSNFALARYTANGRLDSSFGDHGKVISNIGGSASIKDIVIHENRLYAVGDLTLTTGETYGVVAAYELETPMPAISVSIADVTVLESRKLAIATVHLSAPATQRVLVHYTTRDLTAVHSQDYVNFNGALLFIPGFNRTAKVFIPIVDDTKKEGNEQFEIVLTYARNATIKDSVGLVTIIDDDALITKQNTSLRLNAGPNPSEDVFTIQVQGSDYKQPVSIRVYDVSGKLVEQRANISIGQSFRLGDHFKAGAYIIEAVQGSRRVQTKVIKTGK